MTVAAHPFAAHLRTIGRGPTLSRPLDEEQAEQAMAMILAGEVEPVQLGAFLLVLRYRTETAAELAGFVRAARARLGATPNGADLDWPSYADRHKQLPYFLLAARALAEHGVRVLMRGIAGEGDATTPKAVAALGLPIGTDADGARRALDRQGFAYVALEGLLPELARLFELRPLLGLRSPVNSLARALNPFGAPAQIQGVFHPNYAPLHAETALLLGQPATVVFKGGGGEAQRNPEKPCRALVGRDGAVTEVVWPAPTAGAPLPLAEGVARSGAAGRALAGRMDRARPRGGSGRDDRGGALGSRPGRIDRGRRRAGHQSLARPRQVPTRGIDGSRPRRRGRPGHLRERRKNQAALHGRTAGGPRDTAQRYHAGRSPHCAARGVGYDRAG